MDLRRLAQANAMASPTRRLSHPSTTDARVLPNHSISASLPFDWEAARGLRSPPYSPLGPKPRGAWKSRIDSPNGKATPTKRAVRKKSLYERITALPSRIAFEISIFLSNVPLPAPKTLACLIGGTLHFIHFCIRVSQNRSISESDVGREDMYREDNNVAWFDWTVPMTCVLIIAASLNTLLLFTHTKLYHLFIHPARPHRIPSCALHLSANKSTCARESPTHTCVGFIPRLLGLLLGITPSSSPPGSNAYGGGTRVQDLEVWSLWTPSEGELVLFCVYSPVHAVLWMLWNAGNWIMMAAVMVGVSFQVRTCLTRTFEAMLKDRMIIAAEVLHKYDEKVKPLRKYITSSQPTWGKE
ncbi:hypothetical protein V8E52_005625 [Russula decolorans]